jgi:ABC-type glucose/galactose transport system permease subunit
MTIALRVCGVMIQEIGEDMSSGLMVKLNLIISTALPLSCMEAAVNY